MLYKYILLWFISGHLIFIVNCQVGFSILSVCFKSYIVQYKLISLLTTVELNLVALLTQMAVKIAIVYSFIYGSCQKINNSTNSFYQLKLAIKYRLIKHG